MNNFYEFLTPEEYHAKNPGRCVEELTRLAKAKPKTCCNCDELVWRAADTGMCFTCTTGEADAGEDYELVDMYKGKR